MTDDPIKRSADGLSVGDRILAAYLPAGADELAVVLFVKPYAYVGEQWVFVVFQLSTGLIEATHYKADNGVEIFPAPPEGHGYSRADDDPEVTQPIAGRLPAHLEDGETGEVVMVGPAPIAQHYDASAFAGDADCACGETFGGPDAVERLSAHVAAGNVGRTGVVMVGGHAAVEVAGGLVEVDAPGCPAHGPHPHYFLLDGEAGVCLDCPQCRPAGSSVD